MRIVAEGIETEEQLRFIRNTGCDEGQGYLLGEPLEEKQVIHLLTNGRQAESPLLLEILSEEGSLPPNLISLREPKPNKKWLAS